MALFITFEGVEGSGKTTQIRRLKRYLSGRGYPCTVTREPGGTFIGEKIRRILLNPDHQGLAPLGELFLYEAARAQHVRDVIRPLLRKRGVILCDRFADASLAYQGYGRKVDLVWVERLNRLATGGIEPDLTLLLDCPTDLGLKRAVRRNRALKKEREGRFEMEQVHFHRQVRRGYHALAHRRPHRVKRIDTRAGEDRVFDRIRRLVDHVLRTRGVGARRGKPGR